MTPCLRHWTLIKALHNKYDKTRNNRIRNYTFGGLRSWLIFPLNNRIRFSCINGGVRKLLHFCMRLLERERWRCNKNKGMRAQRCCMYLQINHV
ncbi:hypothetical protein MIMGU_mgv1a023204mg [Erythranthe guttata]|uniref:Uncharacterized protein n=1 Tax=Erythranthe guttata TaxID=4155 RepID=A0A022PNW6_ERYGU|nr:hypothetical protein MIMGU_mgv1a023204mg [Erythranthe guttata]